jgi:phosphohistidine phosphatase
MKILYILRHGKAQEWNEEGDKARELTQRGIHDAGAIGTALAEKFGSPDLVISSDAVRAAQTARIVCKECGYKSEISWRPEIYEASPGVLLDIIRNIPKKSKTALLVGHNPGFESIVKYLVTNIPEFFVLKTASLAAIRIKGDWQDAQIGSGELINLLEAKSKESKPTP